MRFYCTSTGPIGGLKVLLCLSEPLGTLNLYLLQFLYIKINNTSKQEIVGRNIFNWQSHKFLNLNCLLTYQEIQTNQL